MNNSLNKKWWIPREEDLAKAVLVNGNTRKSLVKDVLIYIKDNFEQLPGGHVDLNAVTINLCKDENWDKGLVELESIAVLFDSRVDEETGKTIMFFDVIEFKDLPNGASSVTTESIGLDAEILVRTHFGDIEYFKECEELNDELYPDHPYALSNKCIFSDYHDSYIHKNDASEVVSSGLYFHNDSQPDCVRYSEWNQGFVDYEDDCVFYGYVSSDGDKEHFYEDDYVYCEDTDRYYASHDIALDVDNVRWCERIQEYTNRPESQNAGYRELNRKFKLTPNTTFGIGFEVEKEDYDCVEIPYDELYSDSGWAKEDDSSLCDESGYELVSPAFDLHTDDLEKDLEKFPDLKRLINAAKSTSCGGHITVSSSLYSAHEMLEGLSAFFPLLYALYDGRTECDYSRPKEKWQYHQGGGRDAINSRGNRSVAEADHKTFGAFEMRIFSAVIDVKNLLWRRDLVRIMVENFGKSEKDVLRLLMNPKSKLFRHLIKVYNVQRMVNKISLYVSHSKTYNHKVITMPDLTELLNKFKESLHNNNDSTNELGA